MGAPAVQRPITYGNDDTRIPPRLLFDRIPESEDPHVAAARAELEAFLATSEENNK